MRFALLLLLTSSAALAQSPAAMARRLAVRRDAAARAVAQAIDAERQARFLPARHGSVAVIGGAATGDAVRGLTTGLSDLVATDLARVHSLRVVERMQAQAIVRELARSGVDEWSRPRAWRLLGAADIVVVEAQASGATLRLTARVVNMARARVDATLAQSGSLDDVLGMQRRLSLDVLRALGVEPTAAERRAITDRRPVGVSAFVAWAAAMDAIESGDAPQAERYLRQAMEADPGVNAAFDASQLAAAGLATTLGGVVPMPGSGGAAGDDPSEAGLATEGNESEYGEAWFEGAGDRRLDLWEMAVPLSASLSLLRGRLDVSTIWSSNRADTPANDVFHAAGFTDVHLRFTQPVGTTGVSFSVGAALPTRDVHGVDDDIRRVPLPPDLLPTAMYRRRSAPSVSAGAFFTRSLGAWSWGAAAAGEWNGRYDELSPSLSTVAVEPGLRWRLRADGERPLGAGRLSIGSALMAVAPATRAGRAVTGGARALLRAAYTRTMGAADVEVGAWALRAEPVRLAGLPSLGSIGVQLRPGSTIGTLFAHARTDVGPVMVDAGFEAKRWTAFGTAAAELFVPRIGLTRALTRTMLAEVGADYVAGHFHEPPSTSDLPVRGWLLRIGFRFEP